MFYSLSLTDQQTPAFVEHISFFRSLANVLHTYSKFKGNNQGPGLQFKASLNLEFSLNIVKSVFQTHS